MAQIRRGRPGRRVEWRRETVATATIARIIARLVAIGLPRVIVGRRGHKTVRRCTTGAVTWLIRCRGTPNAGVLRRGGNVRVYIVVIDVRRLRVVCVTPLGLARSKIALYV